MFIIEQGLYQWDSSGELFGPCSWPWSALAGTSGPCRYIWGISFILACPICEVQTEPLWHEAKSMALKHGYILLSAIP